MIYLRELSSAARQIATPAVFIHFDLVPSDHHS